MRPTLLVITSLCLIPLAFAQDAGGPSQAQNHIYGFRRQPSPGRQHQTITFNPILSQAVGTSLNLSAKASSGLAVSFFSFTPKVCTVSGSTANLVRVGTCTIVATQEGNAEYEPAPPVWRTFAVTGTQLTAQTITFGPIAAQTAGTTLPLNATASSGLPVSFASQTTGVCTVSGSVATLRAAGTCTIQATQAGNSTYAAATPVSQSFTVNGEAQTITFSNPGAQTVGTPLTLSASATSGLTVSFASQTTSVCTVSGSTATFIAAGTCTIQATQAGNSTWAAATPVSQSFTVKAATGGPLTITTTSCPGGTQGGAYAGCTIGVTGGTPPYTFSLDASGNYPPLPEGLALNAATGVIGSAQVGGQGSYTPRIIVKDAANGQAAQTVSFAINGNNAFAANIFPSSSIFHHRVDAATTGLPVDTSPAAPMYSGYLTATVKPFFGNTSGAPFPNGIPMFEVPYNQPDVAVTTTVYQSYFTSGPIPANAPVEGTSASVTTGGDMHVLIYREAGGGNPPALYEMWQGIYEGGPWTDSSNALWPDVTSNALTPQGNGTSDAAGLPVAPLLVNADEVIGSGTPSQPGGTIRHPIRFTLNHMLNYWVWPATETAGVGSCTSSSGASIPTGNLISQSAPPKTCTMSGAAGEIYRLKASVATPSCASSSPQAAIIITAFRNYGIILADNGISGGLIGTPDARWNDNDLECLTSLTLGNFEPVNVSSLMVTNDSGATSDSASQQSQTITFANPGSQLVGTPLALAASSTSGLAVSFASQTTSVCTVSGATATFLAAGTCSIQATQTGGTTYLAATPVLESFTVSVPSSTGGTYAFPAGPVYTTSSGQHALARTIAWNPGIPGGVPQRTTICATLSPTGAGDDTAINTALASCPATQVVLLKAGVYDIRNAIMIPSNVVLRGSGGPGLAQANQTRLMANASLYGPVVNLGNNLFPHATGTSVSLTADALQGATSATVSSASGFNAGDLVIVDMLVDSADDTGAWITAAPAGGTGLVYPYAEYNPANSPSGSDSRGWFSRANRPIGQIMEIQSVSGNTITFSTPFHMTFDTKHAAQVTAFDTPAATNAGLEDVYVSGVPAPGGSAQYNNVVFSLAKYSWVKNVESDQSNGYSIGIDESFRCVVRDSYMHSTINPTPGGAGYGLEFSWASADNLAENNISWNFNKVMVMRASGGGNVVAYNYMDDGWIAYQPNWVESGVNAAHMTTPHFELFEGNLSFALGSDDTWGGSIFITWLRNVATNHRAAWPPLNAYLFNSATQAQGGCTTTGPFDDSCVPYTDAGNRAAAIANYGDDFFNYVANVLGSSGMPAAPEVQGFTYANAAPDWPSDPVPMWTIGFGDWNGDSQVDQGVANTVFRDGNYDYATNSVKWAGSPQAIPSSLYASAKPDFFGTTYVWPWSDGSNASQPYYGHAFSYYPLSTTFGTFGTAGTKVSYPGYQLPAFVRFLELHGIEQPPAGCGTATLGGVPAGCTLLVTGVAP